MRAAATSCLPFFPFLSLPLPASRPYEFGVTPHRIAGPCRGNGSLQRRPAPDQHVIVAGAKPPERGRKPHHFPQAAPHPVALHGIADLARHGKADPDRPTCLTVYSVVSARCRACRTKAPAGALAACAAARKSVRRFNRSMDAAWLRLWWRFGLRSAPDCVIDPRNESAPPRKPYALSFLRPCARRRARTLRPPLVAMRVRKPWRRLRTNLLG